VTGVLAADRFFIISAMLISDYIVRVRVCMSVVWSRESILTRSLANALLRLLVNIKITSAALSLSLSHPGPGVYGADSISRQLQRTASIVCTPLCGRVVVVVLG
jgi:hypothetical protein